MVQAVVEFQLAQDLARRLDHPHRRIVAERGDVLHRQRGQLRRLMAEVDLTVFQHHPPGGGRRDDLIIEPIEPWPPAKMPGKGGQAHRHVILAREEAERPGADRRAREPLAERGHGGGADDRRLRLREQGGEERHRMIEMEHHGAGIGCFDASQRCHGRAEIAVRRDRAGDGKAHRGGIEQGVIVKAHARPQREAPAKAIGQNLPPGGKAGHKARRGIAGPGGEGVEEVEDNLAADHFGEVGRRLDPGGVGGDGDGQCSRVAPPGNRRRTTGGEWQGGKACGESLATVHRKWGPREMLELRYQLRYQGQAA